MICADLEPVPGKRASLAAVQAPRRTDLDELALQIGVLHVRRRQEDEHERHQFVLGRRLEHLRSESVREGSAVRTTQGGAAPAPEQKRTMNASSLGGKAQELGDVLDQELWQHAENFRSLVRKGEAARRMTRKSVQSRCRISRNPGKTGGKRSLTRSEHAGAASSGRRVAQARP
mgnify:CR=1 FL=1|jgi:hypothetical protein